MKARQADEKFHKLADEPITSDDREMNKLCDAMKVTLLVTPSFIPNCAFCIKE